MATEKRVRTEWREEKEGERTSDITREELLRGSQYTTSLGGWEKGGPTRGDGGNLLHHKGEEKYQRF